MCFRLLHVYIASIYMTKKFNPYIWPKNSHLPLPHHHPHYPIHYHFDPSHHYLHLSIPYQYIENTITNQGFFGFWFLNSLSKKKKHTHTHTTGSWPNMILSWTHWTTIYWPINLPSSFFDVVFPMLSESRRSGLFIVWPIILTLFACIIVWIYTKKIKYVKNSDSLASEIIKTPRKIIVFQIK